jgi:hypothetical protein
MMGRRPKRSPKGASNNEPIDIPSSPALSRMPSWAPASFHSAAMLDAVKATTSTSKPSSMLSPTQIATATT